jgi:hypothetical protein
VLSPPPGLSQSATSFIASCCQGIHQTPFSRLIRSRRRRALLRGILQRPTALRYLRTVSYRASRYLRKASYRASRYLRTHSKPQPAPWLWSEVDLTRWLAPSAAATITKIDAAFSVSVIDLERLSLVSYRASRYLRTDPRTAPNAGRARSPLGTDPKTSRVLLSSRCQSPDVATRQCRCLSLSRSDGEDHRRWSCRSGRRPLPPAPGGSGGSRRS